MSHDGGDSVKSILFALVANAGIAIAKGIAAVMTGSGAMVAEAVHSSADCGNQLLLLWGIKSAKKPPSPDAPLGYGKEIYFWSFIVSLMLFSLGGAYSLYEGIHKLHSPGELKSPWIAVGVLAFSILLEGGALNGCLKAIKKLRGDSSLWQWCKDTRRSELVVVLGEDVAAICGLICAMGAILLSIFTGNPVYDAYGTIIIGFLLLFVAIMIAVKIKGLLVGKGVDPKTREQIQQFLKNDEAIGEVYNFLTLQLGDDIMLAVKAKLNSNGQAADLISQINACEARIKGEFPQVMWLFFEPDDKA